MNKAQQAIEGYKWLSENEEVILRYLEALEQGECHESIMKVGVISGK